MKKGFVYVFIIGVSLSIVACSEEKTPKKTTPTREMQATKNTIEEEQDVAKDEKESATNIKPVPVVAPKKVTFEPEPEPSPNPYVNYTEDPYPGNEIMAVEEEIYDAPEIAPEFPGGNEALINFLRIQISYPADAKENNIQGKVFVCFIVRSNGTITDVQLLRGIYPSIDREALRVVKSMPHWKPALQKGEPVSSRMKIPVQFRIGD